MIRRAGLAASVAVLVSLATAPVSAASATVDQIEDFGSVLAVALPANFPVGSLMRADCEFVLRVERPDGSARETQLCRLSDEPVMVPLFQGTAPDTAFHHGGGPCIWTSDYWWTVAGRGVYASSFSYVVTPSGIVRITATYPATPLTCA